MNTPKILLLFCKPESEFYYSYAINTLDKMYIIEKDELKSLILNNFIDRKLYKKACKFIDCLNTFSIDVESLTINEVWVESISSKAEKKLAKDSDLTFIEKSSNFIKKFTSFMK